MSLTTQVIELCERRVVPDELVRFGIRRLSRRRLVDEGRWDPARADARFRSLLAELRTSPLAIETDAANEQHYEVPAAFFELCLGRRLKYSSAYYPTGRETLDEAELAMLDATIAFAEVQDGQSILELGCGWGSLTLELAARFPRARITGVSNSNGQRASIEARARARGLDNVTILTRDVNVLELPAESFDRVVSVEMFEHVRNYERLFANVARWLRPEGKLFAHVFCHRTLLYPFEVEGDDDWMSRHFFSGGLMPSADTLLHFQGALVHEERRLFEGTHYERTSNHWLANLDARSDEAERVLAAGGVDDPRRAIQRWRMFFMACAELFGYAEGREWMVAHHRFAKR